MRLLHVISAFQMGGAESVAIDVSIGLTQRRHEVLVAAIGRPASYDDVGEEQKLRLSEEGVSFVELGGTHTRTNLIWVPWKLSRLIRRWKPDLVHSHTDIPDAFVSVAHRLTQFPLARTIQNSVLWSSRSLVPCLVESRFRRDLVVCVSEDARTAYLDLRRRCSLEASPDTVLIRNAVDVASIAWRQNRGHIRDELGLEANKVQFCFAGRFDPQKGIDVLFEAVEHMSDSLRSRIQVHLFGDGPLKEHFSIISDQSSLPMRFHGRVPRVARLFPAFDAILIPSRFEGMPLVAIEGLLSAVPVIASDAPGLREALPVDWPLVFRSGDSQALGSAMARLAHAPGSHTDLVLGAKAWAESLYGIDRCVDSYERAYSRFLY